LVPSSATSGAWLLGLVMIMVPPSNRKCCQRLGP
jgi:hypothetical protein